MNKRLTIKNYDRIIGREMEIQPDSLIGWTVTSVLETDEYYEFRCTRATGQLEKVRLGRNPSVSSEGENIYYFISGETIGVTPDWFADLDNAVKAIKDTLQANVLDNTPF